LDDEKMQNMQTYFDGLKLYGDDFGPERIVQWYEEEKNAYAQLVDDPETEYRYAYDALNEHHGFQHLGIRKYDRVLGLGSALGHELKPILARCGEVTILEPASDFHQSDIEGVPVRYVDPSSTGELSFGDRTFDLVTVLGVLHHIPNVSFVIKELGRVLKHDGRILLREPIVSMGDWRRSRRGLTKNERGIPIRLLREMIDSAELVPIREARCVHSLTSAIGQKLNRSMYNTTWAVALDDLLCRMPVWPVKYHAVSVWQKLRPTSVFYVLGKAETTRY